VSEIHGGKCEVGRTFDRISISVNRKAQFTPVVVHWLTRRQQLCQNYWLTDEQKPSAMGPKLCVKSSIAGIRNIRQQQMACERAKHVPRFSLSMSDKWH